MAQGDDTTIDTPNFAPDLDEGDTFGESGVVDYGDDAGPQKEDSNKKKKKKKSGGFESMELSPAIFKGIKHKGYKLPTPIQRKAIPVIMSQTDAICMARTGSGKTAAFLIPMFERLKEHSSKVGVRALILAPTRELAVQTFQFCKELGKYTNLRYCLIVGGDSIDNQFTQMTLNPDVIIATPGRLLHIISEAQITLNSMEYLVFDEADRLFEMGFQQQLTDLMKRLPETRQTLLFSATLPAVLVDFCKAGLRDPEFIRLDVDMQLSENLQVTFFTVRTEEKEGALVYLLREFIDMQNQQTIVFTATKHHVEYLHNLLNYFGIPSTRIYGDMDQTARKESIQNFKNRKFMVLIVTDVAARGIDIPLLDNVINYDFPEKPKLFVHRVGRAARAGRSGSAYSILSPDEIPYMLDLHLFLGRPLLNEKPENIQGNEIYYGTLPHTLFDMDSEFAKTRLTQDPELQKMKNSCSNAMKLYMKTRMTSSHESIKRAKTITLDKINPLVLEKMDSSVEAERNDMLNDIKKFRPNVTILERGDQKSESALVMKAKRSFHKIKNHDDNEDGGESEGDEDNNEDGINAGGEGKKTKTKSNKKPKQKTKEEEEEERKNMPLAQLLLTKKRKSETIAEPPVTKKQKQTEFKDEEFYMGYEPKTNSGNAERGFAMSSEKVRMQDMVMEVAPEDAEGLNKRKRKLIWDKKKKNYVQADPKKPGNSGIDDMSAAKLRTVKTESGNKITIKEHKPKLYEKWKAKNKNEIQMEGETEDASNLANYRKRKRGQFEEEDGGGEDYEDERGDSRFAKKGKSSRNDFKNGKPRQELKSADQIKKQRKDFIKRKEKMQNKGKKKDKMDLPLAYGEKKNKKDKFAPTRVKGGKAGFSSKGFSKGGKFQKGGKGAGKGGSKGRGRR